MPTLLFVSILFCLPLLLLLNRIELYNDCDCEVFDSEMATTEPFVFLSIFKWEDRKGWDVLLESYWTAFSSSDHVLLKLRTYLPYSRRVKQDSISDRIKAFAMRKFGKSLDSLAKVEWEVSSMKAVELAVGGQSCTKDDGERALTRAQIRNLLHSSDAFILPTRGEGWGLPIVEAMSMALPVIVSNVSGPMEYATEDNAYIIPIHDELRTIEGYAEINVAACIDIMKEVHSDNVRNKWLGFSKGSTERCTCRRFSSRGISARKTVQAITPENVVQLMNARIRGLLAQRGWDNI